MIPQEFFSPLLRQVIGFDRISNTLSEIEQDNTNKYPPYNIEKINTTDYRISLAVPGFDDNDIEITVDNGALLIKGWHKDEKDEKNNTANKNNNKNENENNRSFLYRGISEHGFERRFSLADNVEVQNADIDKGVLHVSLHRTQPENEKIKRITIGSNTK